MKRRRKPSDADGLASLADVLPAICTNLALDRKVHEMALLALWPKQAETLLGAGAAAKTRATRLQKQGNQIILHVKVSEAALASELGFVLSDLTAALNNFEPQTGIRVDRIRVSVGD